MKRRTLIYPAGDAAEFIIDMPWPLSDKSKEFLAEHLMLLLRKMQARTNG